MQRQPFTTTKLAARERAEGPPPEGGIRWVSTHSHWNESTWYLDNETPGTTRTNGGVYWPELKPQLLSYARAALWSLLVDPRGAAAPKIGSLPTLTVGLGYLARWMEYRNYADFGELRPESCDQFLEDLIRYNLDGGHFGQKLISLRKVSDPDPDLSESMVWARVNIWHVLHRQSGALKKLGIPAIGFTPFEGLSAKKLATETATKLRQRIPPIPDEIALPILQKAHADIAAPADDLIDLLEGYVRTYPINGKRSRHGLAAKANAELATFEFRISDDGAPWHSPITADGGGDFSPPVKVRRMISRVRAACGIVLHAAAGVRINELCSVEGGWKEGAEFPACIEIRESKSSFNDILVLKGRLSKEEDKPTRHEWVIGSRVRGSAYVPSAAKAVQILERLYRPWRAICTNERLRNSLMLSFTGTNGLPRREESIGPISSHRLRNDMQKYIAGQVAWDELSIPDTSRHGEDLREYRRERGANITPHQWRKTFALFIFRIDANMTGALAQQFKHLSLAMTEEAYIGNDPALLQAFDDVHLQQTVRFFHEMATGEKLVSGRVAKLIDRHEADLDKLIAGIGGAPEQRAAVETFCVQQDLRIWYASHGKCLIGLSPKSARCHAIAGTTHWSNKMPAFQARTPSTCAGCDCFVVDPEHVGFWEARAAETQAAYDAATTQGRGADYRVLGERAKQARAFVQSMTKQNGKGEAA